MSHVYGGFRGSRPGTLNDAGERVNDACEPCSEKRAIAYSMDALLPGLYVWAGPFHVRIGGSIAEPNYPGTVKSWFGAGIVLPGYRIFTTYRGDFDA
ncbi:hypothetical protein [Gloeobacter violaceus]|uniref:Gsl3900 protein n=1 Tax=Gloeobacter violaceus (strain ATCC 29082 / PCC 7421) TaxID=251221 RepID=Q7NEH9_GLOVI|nr:gsl3900 [Gloeobacter violaceus PCC 7421]